MRAELYPLIPIKSIWIRKNRSSQLETPMDTEEKKQKAQCLTYISAQSFTGGRQGKMIPYAAGKEGVKVNNFLCPHWQNRQVMVSFNLSIKWVNKRKRRGAYEEVLHREQYVERDAHVLHVRGYLCSFCQYALQRWDWRLCRLNICGIQCIPAGGPYRVSRFFRKVPNMKNRFEALVRANFRFGRMWLADDTFRSSHNAPKGNDNYVKL